MNNYNDFVKRFNVSHVRLLRDRDYQSMDYGYNRNAGYYNTYREETLEMEISRIGFEELVKITDHYEQILERNAQERYMQRMHPAISEAHDKYRMLLELYR